MKLVKTVHSIFIVGLLALAIVSVIGLVYLSQMAFDKNVKCGDLNHTQHNIAKVSIVVLWLQFVWIILGTYIQDIWSK